MHIRSEPAIDPARLFMKPQTKPFIVVIKPSRRIDRAVRSARTVFPVSTAKPRKTGETPKQAGQ
jgi:hypothetical protein